MTKPRQGTKHRKNASLHSTRLIDLTELAEEASRQSKAEIPCREVQLLEPDEEELECIASEQCEARYEEKETE